MITIKITILSDIHGNLTALKAVLKDAYNITKQRGIESYLVPNDIWCELDEKWKWNL